MKLLTTNHAALPGPRNAWRHIGPSGYFKPERLCLCKALALIFCAAAVFGFLVSCSADSSKALDKDPRKQTVMPVTVSPAIEKTVPVELREIGNVQPYSTVSVKAQIAGELVKVHFKEGQNVKKGDLLFTIDPAPFDAALKQAQANLAKDKAQLENARKQVQRYGAVVKKGYVAEEQYDQVFANAGALEASVKADEAAVRKSAIDLDYCFIRSPIDGFTGVVKVDQGNVVKANDNDKPMVIINQTSPIYVSFSVPERNLPEVKRQMAMRRLDVLATVPGDEEHPARGHLTFLDNAVDQTTGTIQLKATFENKDKTLWPGQFVSVVLTLSSQAGAVVVPSHAIQTGQEGQYVFVVRPDSTVEYRHVTIGRTLEGESVVENGIKPGESIVTDGQLRLAPDALVKVVQKTRSESEAPIR